MARALGSYPGCRWFKSDCRYHPRPVGQEVKTSPFHGGIMGSIPVRVTIAPPRKSSLQKDLWGLHIYLKHHLFVVCSLFSKNLLSSRKSASFRLFVFTEIQRVRHSVGNLSLRLLKHMTIDVAGGTYAGMSQRSRNRHNIHALIDKQGAEQVSEAM